MLRKQLRTQRTLTLAESMQVLRCASALGGRRSLERFVFVSEKLPPWAIGSGCPERYESENSLILNLGLHVVTRSMWSPILSDYDRINSFLQVIWIMWKSDLTKCSLLKIIKLLSIHNDRGTVNRYNLVFPSAGDYRQVWRSDLVFCHHLLKWEVVQYSTLLLVSAQKKATVATKDSDKKSEMRSNVSM